MSEKRLIDANALIALAGNDLWEYEVQQIEYYVSKTPTVDAVEVVRCKDCKRLFPHRKKNGEVYFYSCDFHDIEVEADDFCSYGERRTDGNL